MNFYSNYTGKAESYINNNFFTTPQGFVDSSLKGFTLSFGISILLAKQNHLGAGVRAGALSVAATTIDAVVRIGITFIQQKCFPQKTVGGELFSDALKGSFLGALYIGDRMDLQINNKVSALASLALYCWGIGNRETAPIYGFVAHG